jgi:ribonucleoside-diphosphate reductase alpha chain
MEITLPTKPLNNIEDEDGEIALCTLSAFNLGTIENLAEFEELSDLIVRALDALLDYQDYPVKAAKDSSLSRRSLGVGVINYAYYLAKNGVRYSDGSANRITHELFEVMQYYLLKASNNLAKEVGPCKLFQETKYSDGIMPIDRYVKTVDSLCDNGLLMDWDSLRESIIKFGLRNSTLTALMPSETSSQISNATNGIEPPRGLVSIKSSKDGVLKQVVPEIDILGTMYETVWNIKNNKGYLDLVAIMQKFVDQSISANTNYNPANYTDGKVPIKEIIKDILYAYKNGVKTLYYHNTKDSAGEVIEDSSCDTCKI